MLRPLPKRSESLGLGSTIVHLPDGAQTAPEHPLGDFPTFKWEELAPHLPQDLTGWSVLDIGCNAGYYSFKLAERGGNVLGIDVDEHYLAQANWLADELGYGDRVHFERMQVYDLAHTSEKFDLVIFMGVLYHLRYPMLGLDTVSRRVRKLMVLQTLSLPATRWRPCPTISACSNARQCSQRLAQDGVYRAPTVR